MEMEAEWDIGDKRFVELVLLKKIRNKWMEAGTEMR